MAPRLNKRQQRELEEISALAGPSNQIATSSEDEDQNLPTKISVGSGFAALFTPEEVSESADEGTPQTTTKSRKSKKKKKKVPEASSVSQTLVSPAPSEPSIESTRTHHAANSPAKNEKKAMKKARAKERKAGKQELDRALAELSVKYPDLQRISTTISNDAMSSNSTQSDLSALLSVSLSHLDSEAEMRRFFGAKVVSAHKPTTAGSPGPSRRKPGVQRSYLAHIQPNWPANLREGLSISPLSEEELLDKMVRQSWDSIPGEKWWRIEYSKKYRSITMSFVKIVAAGDPDGFWELFRKLPWHADTFLQLSEVFRYREEYAQAVDFVERALFTYERSFVGAFNFTSGLNRLDFDRVENRPFFLAVHRQVVDLQRRGCVRTAFEFARLLYSLDPWNDPYGALLHLDCLALKAGMSQWLLDVFDHFCVLRESGRHHKARIDPSQLPGWVYARALALRINEGNKEDKSHETSTTALKDAILSFPAIVPLLADKLDVSLSPQIRSKRCFRIQTDASSLTSLEGIEHLLAHLYAQRSAPVWKDPAYCRWFGETVTSLCATAPPEIPTNGRRLQFLELYSLPGPKYSAYRHVISLGDGHRRLSAFIPKEILLLKMLNYDPLPPPTSVNQYDEEFFEGTEDLFSFSMQMRRGRAADGRMLRMLIPDALLREQLQAIFDANPHFAERFPGGIIQFAQAAAQLPEDEIMGMMIDQVMRDERVMPGHMPGDDMVLLEFGEGDAEDAPAVAAQPLDLARAGFNGEVPDLRELDPEVTSDEDGDDESSGDDDVAPLPVRILRNIMNRFWGGNNDANMDDSSEDEEGVLDIGGVD